MLIVSVLEKVGFPDGGTKPHDAPLGSGPMHPAKIMGISQGPWGVIVMVLEPDEPAATVMSPDVDTMAVQDC